MSIFDGMLGNDKFSLGGNAPKADALKLTPDHYVEAAISHNCGRCTEIDAIVAKQAELAAGKGGMSI